MRYIWPKGDFEIFSLVLASNPTWGVPVGRDRRGDSWSSLFWGKKRLVGLLSRERQGWLKKLIDLWNICKNTCVCVCSHYAICESFILLTLAPFPTSVTYHKIDMYRDAKLLPRCKINTTRISTCLASFLGEGASLDIYRQHRSLECSSQLNESQDIHMQNVNHWTMLRRRATTSWEPYTHESYNLK